MAYGSIKVDNIIFTNAGADQTVTVSGLYAAGSVSGNITVTGTISGLNVYGTTVSGTTVNAVTANITTGIFPSGTAAAPSIQIGTTAGVSKPGVYSPGADQVSISTSGTERLRFDSTGQIEAVSLGTAAAPTYSFTTDPNTGIYSPGADQVAISTNGTGRLFVNASGNVSIATNGTSAASEALCINGFAGFGDRALTNPFILLGNTGSGAGVFGTYSNHALEFRTNNTERMRLDTSGRLGLGTSSPSQQLHVIGNAIIPLNNSYYCYTAEYGMGTGTGLEMFTGSGDVIRFLTGGKSGTERLRIDSSGRLGIGTTSPSARLQVDWAGGNQFRASNGSATFDILNDSINSLLTSSGPMFYRTGTSSPHIFQRDGGSSEVARFDSSGRLLVGTSSGTGKLTLSGNAVGVPVALTDAATVAVDLSLSNNYTLTLAGNRTLGAPTNQTAGQSGVIVITNGGANTLAFASVWKFPGGTAPTVTASGVDVLAYYVESASRITARIVPDVK
jgi:hypothetical protein